MNDYKKILEGVVNIINATEKSDIGFANICTYIGENCPELKESKEDRIRKWLIDTIKQIPDSSIEWETISKSDVLTWLEKQGEQKPFDYEHANIHQKDFAPKVDIPRYSIGDVLCDKLCTTLNRDAQPNFEIIGIRDGMYICDKCSFPISQQDEYELVTKKVEQKPADWSEEDEVMLDEIIDFFENGTVKLQHDLSLYAHWLKSLKDRYAWKPSDEQMDALQYVYRNLNPPLSDKLGWDSLKTLELMFEQLKKL